MVYRGKRHWYAIIDGKKHKFSTEETAKSAVSETHNGTQEESFIEETGPQTEKAWLEGLQQAEENSEPSEEISCSSSEGW